MRKGSRAKVQIGAELLCEDETRLRSSDYGVRRDGRRSDVARRTDATQSRPYPRQSEKVAEVSPQPQWLDEALQHR